MLIYYRFNNFCSFNCESEFSMSAPAGKVKKRFPDNYVETAEGFDLLKSAVIVGENAGGKSNFINSIKYLNQQSGKICSPVCKCGKFKGGTESCPEV